MKMLRLCVWLLLLAALSLPLFSVLASWAMPVSDGFAAFMRHRGVDHLWQTIALLVGVVMVAGVIAVPLAWLVSRYDFVGSRGFSWLLCLPLTLPAYVTAYAYIGMLEDSALMALPYISVRHVWGGVLLLGLALYPYIFVAARFVFSASMRQSIEAAQMLGLRGWGLFWRVGVPLSRPAWIAGGALVAMEVLADYGVASLLALDTLTTGLFRLWFFYQDQAGAVRLASLMLVLVGGLLWLERQSRVQKRFSQMHDVQHEKMVRQPLSGGAAWGACLACVLPLLLGFILPCVMLLFWSGQDIAAWRADALWESVGNSVQLVVVAVVVILAVAWAVVSGARLKLWRGANALLALASVGYAVPGSVIAVALLVPLIVVDKPLAYMVQGVVGGPAQLWLTGTAMALIYAYSVRFTSVAVQQIGCAYAALPVELDESALMLGRRPVQVSRHVHAPLLKRAWVAAALMVAVEVVKELPATLIIRPFDMETLATRSYGLAADQFYVGASHYACMMVLLGAIPLALWQWWSDRDGA